MAERPFRAAPTHPSGGLWAGGQRRQHLRGVRLVGTALPPSPSLAVYYDVADVKGPYLEASIGRAAGAFDFGGPAVYSAGQEINASAPGEVGYFAESGLTHVDFSATTSFDAGGLSIAPAIHFQISGDAATKAITATGTSRPKFWFGFALSWSSILG